MSNDDGVGVHDLVGWLRHRHIDKFGEADQMSSIFALSADEIERLRFELQDMDDRLTDDLVRLMGERNDARARAVKAEADLAVLVDLLRDHFSTILGHPRLSVYDDGGRPLIHASNADQLNTLTRLLTEDQT